MSETIACTLAGGLTETAVNYLRQSSEKQEKSVEQQAEENEKYRAKMGYRLHAEPAKRAWTEVKSGKTFTERRVFQSMLAAAQAGSLGASVIILYRPNRFGRSEDLAEYGHYEWLFRKAGVRIEYASGEGVNAPGFVGFMARNMAYAEGSTYIKNLSKDSTRGMIAAAKLGCSTGGSPAMGYARMLVDADGKEYGILPAGARKGDDRRLYVRYVTDPDGSFLTEFLEHFWLTPFALGWTATRAARAMNKRLQTGQSTLRPSRAGRIIERDDGRTVEFGDYWSPVTVAAMWTNTTYLGWRTFQVTADNDYKGTKIVVQDAHPALVSEEVFWALYSRTDRPSWQDRRLTPAGRRKPEVYPMSGLGKCSHCGRGFSGSRTTNLKKGSECRSYRCSGETNRYCLGPRWAINADEFNTWVQGQIIARLKSGQMVATLCEVLREQFFWKSDADPVAASRSRLEEVERQIATLLDMAAQTARPVPMLVKRLDDLESERFRLDAEVKNVPAALPTIDDAELREAVDKIVAAAEALVQGDRAALYAVAPKFVKNYTVDKTLRLITIEFYAVPGFSPTSVFDKPGTRIGKLEAAGVRGRIAGMEVGRVFWRMAATIRRGMTRDDGGRKGGERGGVVSLGCPGKPSGFGRDGHTAYFAPATNSGQFAGMPSTRRYRHSVEIRTSPPSSRRLTAGCDVPIRRATSAWERPMAVRRPASALP